MVQRVTAAYVLLGIRSLLPNSSEILSAAAPADHENFGVTQLRRRRVRRGAAVHDNASDHNDDHITALRNLDYVSAMSEWETFLTRDLESSMSMSMSLASTQPPSGCVELPEDTPEALEKAVVQANGEQLRLCSTTILFEEQLELSVPVNLVCDGTCVFDGTNSTRLFSFGSTKFPQDFPIDYNIYMKGFVFQKGVVRDRPNGGDGSTPHGGAMLLVGFDTSVAKFENCLFQDNFSILENGGAIWAIHGGNLEFLSTSFERNYAYNGGAISASDVRITIEDTKFIVNTAIGNFEGAAIYVDSSDLENPIGKVTCMGDLNVFKGNTVLPDIVGPAEGCEGSAVLPSN